MFKICIYCAQNMSEINTEAVTVKRFTFRSRKPFYSGLRLFVFYIISKVLVRTTANICKIVLTLLLVIQRKKVYMLFSEKR